MGICLFSCASFLHCHYSPDGRAVLASPFERTTLMPSAAHSPPSWWLMKDGTWSTVPRPFLTHFTTNPKPQPQKTKTTHAATPWSNTPPPKKKTSHHYEWTSKRIYSNPTYLPSTRIMVKFYSAILVFSFFLSFPSQGKYNRCIWPQPRCQCSISLLRWAADGMWTALKGSVGWFPKSPPSQWFSINKYACNKKCY